MDELTFHAQLCLQTAWSIVNTGMDDTTVIAALMSSKLAFLLDQAHLQFRMSREEFTSCGAANYSSTDNSNIVLGFGTCARTKMDSTCSNRSGSRDSSGCIPRRKNDAVPRDSHGN